MNTYVPFELPSNGHLISPHKGELCNLNGLEELERAQSNPRQNSIISGVMQKCIKNQSIQVGELTLPDFTYLKVIMSMVMYGDRFEYPSICPYCKNENRFIRLSKLRTVPFDAELKNKYLVKRLPKSNDIYNEEGDEVEVRIPSIIEGENIVLEKISNPQHAYIMSLVASINKINGKQLNEFEKEIYAQELSPAQQRSILSRVDKLTNFGIALMQEYECEHCQKIVSYPFSPSYSNLFFPDVE